MRVLPSILLAATFGGLVLPASAETPVFTGFYAGLHGQYGIGKQTSDTGLAFKNVSLSATLPSYSVRGAGLGLQAGYWHQFGVSPWRLGAEISLNHRGGSGGFARTGTLAGFPASASLETRLGLSATIRGQVGYAFGRTMPYAFAGVTAQRGTVRGVAQVHTEMRQVETSGWGISPVFGIGVAHAVSEKLTVFAEVNRTRFGRKWSRDLGSGVLASASTRVSQNYVRFGVNYRF